MNSGAEAVETAIKAIRKWGYEVKGIAYPKAEIIVADGNFHGRTTTIVGFSTDPDSTAGFGPFTPGFRIVPYGDLDAVADAITPDTAAIFMEPIQGEARRADPAPRVPAGACAAWPTSTGSCWCWTRSSPGFGRTGKMFAFEHEGIRPDGITVGKALSGGFYPVSAFLSTDEVMDVFTPGIHGSTYGGNPLACAVASAALDVLVDEKLVERSAELGAHLKARLEGLKSPQGEGRALPRPVGRGRPDRGGRPRPDLLLRPQGARHAVQGHPPAHHPPGAAPGHHPGAAGLGRGPAEAVLA